MPATSTSSDQSKADLLTMGLLEVAAAVARREVSPVELTTGILEKIEALQPRLGAFAYVMADEALDRARRLEAEATRGDLCGPLHGVPVAVKDLFDTKDIPTAVGFPMFRNRRPRADATVVKRLYDAGAILIGKTELSEGALAIHHPDVVAPTNPWRADLWTGSSSSGSGVATAAGLCYAAIGTDTGGSIRFPALCNAIVGIKPTWGRVSRRGVFPLSWTLDHVGPMARRVQDAAAMLGVIAGRDDADATSVAAAVPDYVGGLRKSLSGVRLGFDERYATTDVLDETKAILDQAIRILSARGVALRAVKMPETRDAIRSWTPVCLAEAVCVHEHVEGARPDGYSQSFVQFLEAGKGVSGKDYARANLARRQFAGNLNAVFADVDLLLVPVTGNAVPTFEEFARICPDPEGLERLIYFTCIYDVSGHPTITLPAGLSSSGEPLGFQLVAPHLGEDLLCRAGFAWQEDFGWDGRPPLD